jgi:hypothetical protein
MHPVGAVKDGVGDHNVFGGVVKVVYFQDPEDQAVGIVELAWGGLFPEGAESLFGRTVGDLGVVKATVGADVFDLGWWGLLDPSIPKVAGAFVCR